MLIITFVASDIAFAFDDAGRAALAPPLASKPPCQILRNEDGTFDVVSDTDTADQPSSFRDRWAFADITLLIGQMLVFARDHKLAHPKDILIPLISKHIATRAGSRPPDLDNLDYLTIDEYRVNGELRGFTLPVKRFGLTRHVLLYSLSDDPAHHLLTVPLHDGTPIYILTPYTATIPFGNKEYHVPAEIKKGIRPATPFDLMPIKNLSDLIHPGSSLTKLQALQSQLNGQSPEGPFWVYCDPSGAIRGYVCLAIDWQKREASVKELVVDPERRGEEIGFTLMAYALSKAWSEGMRRYAIWAIHPHSARLAKHFGFTCMKKGANDVGDYRLSFPIEPLGTLAGTSLPEYCWPAIPGETDPGNPYGAESSIARSFEELDTSYEKMLTNDIEHLISTRQGKPVKILMVGIGRGMEAFELMHRYGDKIEVAGTSHLDLLYRHGSALNERFKELGTTTITDNGCQSYIDSFRRSGRYLRWNANDPFPGGEAYDIIIFGQHVLEYVRKKAPALISLLDHLAPEGCLYGDLLSLSIVTDDNKSWDAIRYLHNIHKGPDTLIFRRGARLTQAIRPFLASLREESTSAPQDYNNGAIKTYYRIMNGPTAVRDAPAIPAGNIPKKAMSFEAMIPPCIMTIARRFTGWWLRLHGIEPPRDLAGLPSPLSAGAEADRIAAMIAAARTTEEVVALARAAHIEIVFGTITIDHFVAALVEAIDPTDVKGTVNLVNAAHHLGGRLWIQFMRSTVKYPPPRPAPPQKEAGVFAIHPLTKAFINDGAHAAKLMALHSLVPAPQVTKEWFMADRWEQGGETREFAGKWEHSFVAVDTSGQPVGFLIAYERAGGEVSGVDTGSLYVHRFAVSAELQGAGIGTKLLVSLAEDLERNGFISSWDNRGPPHPVSLLTPENNTGAIGFYEGMSFQKVGTKAAADHIDNVYLTTAEDIIEAARRKSGPAPGLTMKRTQQFADWLARKLTFGAAAGMPKWMVALFVAPWYESIRIFFVDSFIAGHDPVDEDEEISLLEGWGLVMLGGIAAMTAIAYPLGLSLGTIDIGLVDRLVIAGAALGTTLYVGEIASHFLVNLYRIIHNAFPVTTQKPLLTQGRDDNGAAPKGPSLTIPDADAGQKPPKGTPGTLLRYMYENGIFADPKPGELGPRLQKDMAHKRGGNDSPSTISLEAHYLREMDLLEGESAQPVHLPAWFRRVDTATFENLLLTAYALDEENAAPNEIELIAARDQLTKLKNRLAPEEADDPALQEMRIAPSYLSTLHTAETVPTLEEMLFKMQVEAECSLRILLNHPPLTDMGLFQQINRLSARVSKALKNPDGTALAYDVNKVIQDEHNALLTDVVSMKKYLNANHHKIGKLYDYKYETRRYIERTRKKFLQHHFDLMERYTARIEQAFGKEQARTVMHIMNERFGRIDGLLAFSSRFLRGVTETRRDNLNAVIRDTAAQTHTEWPGTKKVIIETPADERLADVPFDLHYIQFVIAELVRNALKEASASEVRVGYRYNKHTGCVTLTVSDNGAGIDPALLVVNNAGERQEIFKYGVTSAGKSTTRQEGTGLGLTFLYELMDRVKGSIRADNKPAPDTGAVFAVTFPLKDTAFATIASHSVEDITPADITATWPRGQARELSLTVSAVPDARSATQELPLNPQQIKARVHYHDKKYGTNNKGEPIWMVVDMKRMEELGPGKHRFAIKAPGDFEGEYAFMYSIDGGVSWLPTTEPGNNRRIVRRSSTVKASLRTPAVTILRPLEHPAGTVVWDWDRTLFEPEDDTREEIHIIMLSRIMSLARQGSEAGWERYTGRAREVFAATQGQTNSKRFADLIAAEAAAGYPIGYDAAYYNRRFDAEMNAYIQSHLSEWRQDISRAFVPGALEIVKELRRLGIRQYIVTGNSWLTPDIIQELGLDQYFDGVYSAGHWPYPETYDKTRAITRIAREHAGTATIIIGDGTGEIVSAHEAAAATARDGTTIYTVALAYPDGTAPYSASRAALLAADPDAIIDGTGFPPANDFVRALSFVNANENNRSAPNTRNEKTGEDIAATTRVHEDGSASKQARQKRERPAEMTVFAKDVIDDPNPPYNPYASDNNPYSWTSDFTRRGFEDTDRNYAGDITVQIERMIAASGGKPVRVLMIGVGHGYEVMGLMKRYGNAITITSTAKEDLVYHTPELVIDRFAEDKISITRKEAEHLLQRLRADYLQRDLDEGFSSDATYDIAVFATGVCPYIHDKLGALHAILARTRDGGFVYCDLDEMEIATDREGENMPAARYFSRLGDPRIKVFDNYGIRFEKTPGTAIPKLEEAAFRVFYDSNLRKTKTVYRPVVVSAARRREVEDSNPDTQKDGRLAAAKEAIERFKDAVVYIQEKVNDHRPVIAALGTDWLTGGAPDTELDHEVKLLLQDLRLFCDAHGITLITVTDNSLLSKIADARNEEGKKGAKIIALASYVAEREQDSPLNAIATAYTDATIIGIDHAGFTPDTKYFYRIPDMLELAFKIAFNVPFDPNPHIALDAKRRFPVLIPAAEPIPQAELERFKQLYIVQRNA